MINQSRTFCYRIVNINNLSLLLQNGMVNKHHQQASNKYINIGNPEIIDVRSTTPVRIANYGMIGDYVPFYFTPKSLMLYNIITGYRHPLVPKRDAGEILVVRCLISEIGNFAAMVFHRWSGK